MNLKLKSQEIRAPFFSIGITTYNRKDLLKQTISSLLCQSYSDFEIIVGNDYLNEHLSFENLEITDSRIHIINNEVNLGELGNMNSLLSFATGRYFSWIFDDDLCDPDFLQMTFESLTDFDFPLCVYSSYKFFYGTSEFRFKKRYKIKQTNFSGKEFLRRYLSGKIRALGLGGFHNTEYLIRLGGAQRLSDGHMALYSEYLILIRDGLLQEIAYIDLPLVMVRVHHSAWSSSNSQTELFKQAGINLVKEAVVVFSKLELIEDFQENLASLLNSIISVIFIKSSLGSKKIKRADLDEYIASVRMEIEHNENHLLNKRAIKSLNIALRNIPFFVLKAKIKGLIPEKLMGIVHSGQYIFSRFTNKSF